tara:strand:- start:126267 stop:126563 length:297 start_codon:yes stop_codon:yes gene_type:complete
MNKEILNSDPDVQMDDNLLPASEYELTVVYDGGAVTKFILNAVNSTINISLANLTSNFIKFLDGTSPKSYYFFSTSPLSIGFDFTKTVSISVQTIYKK